MITSYDVTEFTDYFRVSVYWHTHEKQNVRFPKEISLDDYDLWLPDYPEIEDCLVAYLLNN